MIFLVFPAFALSLVPIILIEAIYIARKLGLSNKESFKTVTISNLVSTVVGVPLTWIFLVAIQVITGGGSSYGTDTITEKILAVTWQAPWLIPHEQELYWMVPVAGLVLLIPFFFVSWWSEYLVSKRLLKSVEGEILKLTIRNANMITYGLLTLWPVTIFIASSRG